jgi:cytochrome c oxidase cbb3-type subunit 2
MPGFPWFETTPVDASDIQPKMRALKFLGHPYTDKEIEEAPKQLEGKTQMDAVIAYLQSLGTSVKTRR